MLFKLKPCMPHKGYHPPHLDTRVWNLQESQQQNSQVSSWSFIGALHPWDQVCRGLGNFQVVWWVPCLLTPCSPSDFDPCASQSRARASPALPPTHPACPCPPWRPKWQRGERSRSRRYLLRRGVVCFWASPGTDCGRIPTSYIGCCSLESSFSGGVCTGMLWAGFFGLI